MLREEALRRALQFARDRRGRELEELQERSRALRRRLRELTDRGMALGSVHGRFAPEGPAPAVVATTVAPPAPIATPTASPSPVAPPAAASPAPSPFVVAAEPSYDALLRPLSARHPGGFTVGQLKAVMEELDGKAHTYDAAWALANTLLRTRALELAGSRPGPTGQIRVLRVARERTSREAT